MEGKFGGGLSNSTRVPPHHLEAERSVLGSILVRNEAFDQIREVGIVPEDFYVESHQKIFEVACDLSDKRLPIDMVTLTDSLRSRGWYDQIGGSASLTNLFDEAFAVGNVSHYARLIKNKAILRNLISICSEVIGDAVGGVDEIDAFLDQVETRIFKVSGVSTVNPVSELKNILIENMSRIEELAMSKKSVTGVSTGFYDFDELTSGLQAGQVMIIAARPGMGKTSWFLSALQHAAIKEKSVCAVFSLEMSKEEIGFRFLSGLSRIDSKKLKVGKLFDKDWHALAEAADHLSKAKIFVDDSGGLTVMQIRSRCRRLLASQKKLDLIVIDYLQLMKGPRTGRGGEQSREREISEISRGLKELAKELKVPIIALSQLNRGVEQRQDKRPNLSDLRESGAIEQDADLVCFIHREDYYDKETENQGIAELIVAKNRAGETNTVKLLWIPQYTLFANLSKDPTGLPTSSGRPDRGDITL